MSQHHYMETNETAGLVSLRKDSEHSLSPLLAGLVVLGSEWHLLLLTPFSSLKEQRWSLSRRPSWRVKSSSYSASGNSGVNRRA